MRERPAREHRMFHVIVLGGLALGTASSAMAACGGMVQTNAAGGSGGTADAATGGFPMEGAVMLDAFPSQPDVGFPFEGTGGTAGFVDGSPDVGCFPMETALPSECGARQPDAGVQDAGAQDSAQETPAP